MGVRWAVGVIFLRREDGYFVIPTSYFLLRNKVSVFQLRSRNKSEGFPITT